MQICRRCFYTSHHPLNLSFDNNGICSGCRIHEEKDQLDWHERGERLRGILQDYRNTTGSNYDCIVPVSGARDSFYIVHTIKNVYGMNPLLVTYNKHYNTATGWRNLSQLKTVFNCDLMTLTVNPETVKKITRSTLRRFGSLYWHCIAGQTVFPVQLAVKLKIPLIIWGVHQGIDQVGMFSHLDEVEMTRKYRKEHDLMGYEAEDLIDDFDNIKSEDINSYCYPDNLLLERVGVRGIYLSNYIRWDSRTQHEEMIQHYRYESARQTRTFDSYNDVDCWNYSDTHDYIKWLKCGYGKVVDHVSREVRLGHMTRSNGAYMILEFIRKKPANINLFLDWLGITHNAFQYVIDQHRNPTFWHRDNSWQWKYTSSYLQFVDSVAGDSKYSHLGNAFVPFLDTPIGQSSDPSDRYILIGKGRI